MTGTNCDLFTHKLSRSYLNHLVYYLVFLCISLAHFVTPRPKGASTYLMCGQKKECSRFIPLLLEAFSRHFCSIAGPVQRCTIVARLQHAMMVLCRIGKEIGHKRQLKRPPYFFTLLPLGGGGGGSGRMFVSVKRIFC
jgi:hypothetical protein